MDYDFDINGSLRRKENVDESEFYLFNTFGCMKAYSFEGERFGYYGYDASGERTYKIDFDATFSKENGVIAVQSLDIEKMMLYPNGYMNINQSGEYTKHYYADALRIASKIGSGFTGNLCDSATATYYSGYLNARITFQSDFMVDELNEVVVPTQNIQQINPMPYPTFCNLDSGGQETNLFFYHPDHLGSTGVVTDNNANVTQGFIYSPFGELIYEHNPAWENNRVPKYAFNAKELDEENGMYYYSARYYAPPTFISRDPMFEKYPSINPYSYCRNNPVLFIDPTGMEGEVTDLVLADQSKGTNHTQELTTSLSEITGMNVTTETRNGKTFLSYEKDANGKPIIRTDENGNSVGSETARGMIQNLIDNTDIVNVSQVPDGKGSKGGGNQIGLDVSQIQGFMNGTQGGLNKETMGYGMVFLHEFLHTGLGGNLSDRDVVPKMNGIRGQLGADFGQRMSYETIPLGGYNYMPFDSGSKSYLGKGISPGSFNMFIRY